MGMSLAERDCGTAAPDPAGHHVTTAGLQHVDDMESKEIKAALRAARDAIKQKNYKEALASCKAVLKQDKNSYTALVFVGVAAEGLEQPEQAVAAYKRACDLDNDNILAWQGLCSFYEKTGPTDEYITDLMAVYDSLLKLYKSDDAAKVRDVTTKLGALYERRGSRDEALALYQRALAIGEAAANTAIYLRIISVLTEQGQPSPRETQLLLKAYSAVSEAGSDPDERFWVNYLKLQLKSPKFQDDVIKSCDKCAQKFPDCVFVLELRCRMTLDSKLADVESTTLGDAVTRLEAVAPDSGYLRVIRGVDLMRGGDLVSARRQFREGVEALPDSVAAWLLLATLLMKTHASMEVEKACKQGLTLLERKGTSFLGDRSRARKIFNLLIAQVCLCVRSEDRLDKAETLIKEILAEGADCLDSSVCLAEVRLRQGQLKDARKILEDVCAAVPHGKASALLAWCCHLQEDNKHALHLAREAVSKYGQTEALTHYYLALMYLETSTSSEAVNPLMKAAKLDPFYSPTFYQLGRYYRQAGATGKALRCFEKAYDLDDSDAELGAVLVDMLMAADDGEEKAIAILRRVTGRASAGSAKWAWLRQGLYQVKKADYSSGISSLQCALRADPTDVHCWECLGEAYVSRGSYTAALKAFTKATQLNPEAKYCSYQMASIKQSIGLYDEAVEGYTGLLDTTPDYVPALKGIGETYISMAKVAIKDFFHGRALDYCQKAIDCLTRGATCRPDLSSLWKLLGDATSLLHVIPTERFRLQLPAKLLGQQSQGTSQAADKATSLTVGARCYGMALKLLPDCGALWHDLGVNYFRQTKMASAVKDKVRVALCAAKAVQALQRAVSLEPASHGHWNALGVVAASPEVGHLALAQHCFIKSLEIEPKSAITWTNLGALYMQQGNLELAHEALKKAQSSGPDYVGCWVGQALVADTLAHEDAMDLFRHTTELGNHVEGAVGYAHWVCTTLQDAQRRHSPYYQYAIVQMGAVRAAGDAMAKYTDRVTGDAVAFNLQGVLLEQQGLHAEAARAYQSAVRLWQSQGEQTKVAMARANLARVLCDGGRYEEALAEYLQLGPPTSPDTALGLALAYFKAGQWEHSYSAYEKALSAVDLEAERAQIYTAMAMSAYRSGNAETAKTALFQCSQSEAPSLPGLQALLALAMILKDSPLAAAALQELERRGDGESQQDGGSAQDAAVVHRTYLAATLDLLQGSSKTARNRLLKAIHMYPQRAALWQRAARVLLTHCSPGAASGAARCAESAHTLDGSTPEAGVAMLGVAQLANGQHSRSKWRGNALREVQREIHKHPGETRHWVTLLAALQADQTIKTTLGEGRDLHGLLLSLTAHLMASVESRMSQDSSNRGRLETLHLWLVRHYIVALVSAGRLDQAKQFLQQATWLYEEDPYLNSLQALLSRDLTRLASLAFQSQSPAVWMMLLRACELQGDLGERDKTLRLWSQQSRSKDQQLSALIAVAHDALSKHRAGGAEAGRWLAVFTDTAAQALRLNPSCGPIYLLHGLQALGENNIRSARRHFLLHLTSRREGALPFVSANLQRHLLVVVRERVESAQEPNPEDLLLLQLLESAECVSRQG